MTVSLPGANPTPAGRRARPAHTRVSRTVGRLGGRLLPRGRVAALALPYAWLLLFFLVPFLVVLKISLAEPVIARPPYAPIVEWLDGTVLQIRLEIGNFLFLLDDPLYRSAFLGSLQIAFISTLLCLLIGYPMAYVIARADRAWRLPLLMLVILPFWTSFLIRVYAWIGILQPNGLLNQLLLRLGAIDEPLPLLHSEAAVYLGITYSYLPFMILPLYAILEKLDVHLLEAAADLGARPWKTFLTVTLPMSAPGIVAGSLLVFIPAVGEFVIPELLGGPDTLMIGRVLWTEFFSNRDWPVASAVAIALLVVLVAPMVWFQHVQARQQERGAGP